MWSLAILLAAAPAPSAVLHDAERCAARDGSRKTTRACQRACDAGYLDACYRLGEAQVSGESGKPDPARGLAYFRAACAKKHAKSCHAAGLMLVQGLGATSDVPAGQALLQQACELGDTGACAERANPPRAAKPPLLGDPDP